MIYIRNAPVDVNYNLSGVTNAFSTYKDYKPSDKVYLTCGHTCLISELIVHEDDGDAACFECTLRAWVEHLKIKEVRNPKAEPLWYIAKLSVPDIYKDKADISVSQLWKHKKTNNIVKVESVSKEGRVAKKDIYGIAFMNNGRYRSENRGKFLKLYKRIDL